MAPDDWLFLSRGLSFFPLPYIFPFFKKPNEPKVSIGFRGGKRSTSYTYKSFLTTSYWVFWVLNTSSWSHYWSVGLNWRSPLSHHQELVRFPQWMHQRVDERPWPRPANLIMLLSHMLSLEIGGDISKQKRSNQFMELTTKRAISKGLAYLVSCSDPGVYRPQKEAIIVITYRCSCCV